RRHANRRRTYYANACSGESRNERSRHRRRSMRSQSAQRLKRSAAQRPIHARSELGRGEPTSAAIGPYKRSRTRQLVQRSYPLLRRWRCRFPRRHRRPRAWRAQASPPRSSTREHGTSIRRNGCVKSVSCARRARPKTRIESGRRSERHSRTTPSQRTIRRSVREEKSDSRQARQARKGTLLSGENWIPTFVAPAEAGVQAYARMARRVSAWIPAYAGTTMLLSVAKLKARGCSRSFAPIVVSVIFPGQQCAEG